MTPKDDRRPSALQLTQELCRIYDSLVLSDIRTVQGVIKNAFTSFASACGDELSLADLNKSHAAKKSGMKKSLAASEEKLVEAEHRI